MISSTTLYIVYYLILYCLFLLLSNCTSSLITTSNTYNCTVITNTNQSQSLVDNNIEHIRLQSDNNTRRVVHLYPPTPDSTHVLVRQPHFPRAPEFFSFTPSPGTLKHTPSKVMNCEHCGNSFEATNRAKRFCSERCRKSAERKRYKEKKLHAVQQKRYEETGLRPHERYCKTCGSRFIAKHNGEGYCSEICREVGYEKTRLAGREAARRRYYENKQAHKLECAWCESSFESESKVKYCSDQCRRESVAHRARLNAYGLSKRQYEVLVERSGGLCEICREKEAQHIDHCHDTGAVRGLLCQQCNHGLGNFQDRVALLNRASEYLSKKLAQKF